MPVHPADHRGPSSDTRGGPVRRPYRSEGNHSVSTAYAEPEEIDIHTTAGKLADLQRRIEEAMHASSAHTIGKRHTEGKLTAR